MLVSTKRATQHAVLREGNQLQVDIRSNLSFHVEQRINRQQRWIAHIHMRERAKAVTGQAFIKTGSLRDVTAVAGYVNGNSGARYIVVGMINHPNAGAARPAMDALIQWAVQEQH